MAGPVILAQLPSSAVQIGPAPEYNLLSSTDGSVIGFPVWDVDHRTIYGWQTAAGQKFAGFSSGFGGYDANQPPPNYDPAAWRATQDDINRGADIWVGPDGYTHWGYSDCCNPAPSVDAYIDQVQAQGGRIRLYGNASVYFPLANSGALTALQNKNYPLAHSLVANYQLAPLAPTNGTGGFSTPVEMVTVVQPPPASAPQPVIPTNAPAAQSGDGGTVHLPVTTPGVPDAPPDTVIETPAGLVPPAANVATMPFPSASAPAVASAGVGAGFDMGDVPPWGWALIALGAYLTLRGNR